MALTFTKVAPDAFDKIQINAGVLLTSFDPETGTVDEESIFAATTGGSTFEAVGDYYDFGEDIDNVPANTKQLKQFKQWQVKLSGTCVTADTSTAKMLIGPADISGNHVTPRTTLKSEDFAELWWVGDYGASDGGFIAIDVHDALSTGGFKIQSADSGKGQMAFEFTGHYDLENMDKAPFDVYISAQVAAASELQSQPVA